MIPGSSYQMAFSLQRPSGTLAVKEYHNHLPLLSLAVMVSPGNWFPTSGDPLCFPAAAADTTSQVQVQETIPVSGVGTIYS